METKHDLKRLPRLILVTDSGLKPEITAKRKKNKHHKFNNMGKPRFLLNRISLKSQGKMKVLSM